MFGSEVKQENKQTKLKLPKALLDSLAKWLQIHTNEHNRRLWQHRIAPLCRPCELAVNQRANLQQNSAKAPTNTQTNIRSLSLTLLLLLLQRPSHYLPTSTNTTLSPCRVRSSSSYCWLYCCYCGAKAAASVDYSCRLLPYVKLKLLFTCQLDKNL